MGTSPGGSWMRADAIRIMPPIEADERGDVLKAILSRLVAAALPVLALLVSGCISKPKVTPERVEWCIRQTFAYRNITRGVSNPIALVVEDEDKTAIEVGVFEKSGPDADRRLGTFRVEKRRMMFLWDNDNLDWQPIGVCE